MNPCNRTDAGLIDGLYFRVSSNRQTTENQFADLLSIAEKDASERDWTEIRRLLSQVVYTEQKTGSRGLRTIYRIRPEIVARLADLAVYVEQGISGKVGARRRPVFERMKQDAALRRFDRLLVWKVSRLGRNMREMISTVYELSDAGITTIPIKSQPGPLTSSMGRLLWAVQAWAAEFENDERSENIKSGLKKAIEDGKKLGRPRVDIDRSQVEALRASGASWRAIAARLGWGRNGPPNLTAAFQNPLRGHFSQSVRPQPCDPHSLWAREPITARQNHFKEATMAKSKTTALAIRKSTPTCQPVTGPRHSQRACKCEISPEDKLAVIALQIMDDEDAAEKYRARKGALMEKFWDSSLMDVVFQQVFAALAKGRGDADANVALNEFTAAIVVAAKQCGIA